ncbi:MAG: GGDEF domain-containing protein [Gammaproteobacteria bacterium]|nr:GGDEF domain-containing protein [Gammaproteobacteria bacterium]
METLKQSMTTAQIGYDKRFIMVTNVLYPLGAVVHTVMMLLFIAVEIPQVVYLNLGSALIFIIATALNRYNLSTMALILVISEMMLFAYVGCYYLGWESGFHMFALLSIPVVFLNTQLDMKIKVIMVATAGLIMSVMFLGYHDILYGTIQINPQIVHTVHFGSLAVVVTIMAFSAHYYATSVARFEVELSRSRDAAVLDANTDKLTQLYNRRAMLDVLRRNIEGEIPTDGHAVIMCDIDNFKSINDHYGHMVGDKVLGKAASIMKEQLRRQDAIGRWGGEEFIILLANTNRDEATTIVERLRSSIEQSVAIRPEENNPVTITFGVHHIVHATPLSDCLQSADEALYAGKRAGKNRVMTTW